MPPTRVLLRNSERSSFKTCRFRWALNYGGVLELGPVRSREPAKALWFGDLIHQALAAYRPAGIKRGPQPARTFLKLFDADERVSAVLRNEDGEWESMRDLGKGMLEAYVEEFKDRDDEWEVIASERTFRLPVEVPEFMIELGPGMFLTFPAFKLIVVGTFDGIWRHRTDLERVVFKEYKTASTINTDGLAMDDQASYYWTYGPKWSWRQRILPRGTYPSEILYTFLRKAIRNPDWTYDSEGRKLNQPTKDDLIEAFPTLLEPSMKLDKMIEEVGPERAAQAGAVSKSQPPPYFERLPIYRDMADRRNTHERVLSEAREMMLVRAGVLQPYKNPGPLHNPNCRGCPVRDACELHEGGHSWEPVLRATTESWDPYADHEIIERR